MSVSPDHVRLLEWLTASLVAVEIHNKSDREYRVIKEECIEAMMAMTMVGSDCYGEDNEDTKGGTYQKGSIESGISFHGLPKEGMPAR